MSTLSVSPAAMLALVMLCGTLASCTSVQTTNLLPLACTETRTCPLKCAKEQPREVQICVQFEKDRQGNTCLRQSRHPVVPTDLCICSHDTVDWIAREGDDKSDQKFQVWFVPVTTGLLNLRPSTEKSRDEHTRKIFKGAPAAEYKYTIVGGDPECGDRVYDPRIRIDPH